MTTEEEKSFTVRGGPVSDAEDRDNEPEVVPRKITAPPAPSVGIGPGNDEHGLQEKSSTFEDRVDTKGTDATGNGENEDEDAMEDWPAGEEGDEPAKKKKKKKKKSKGQRKNPPPTGFEDTFAEPPLTVDQHKEDSELYSPEKPFAERIELCIQRYKARRKFDSWRNQIFGTYLTLGGIASGQNKFSGGLDIKPNDDRDAEDIAKFTATDYVPSALGNVGTKQSDAIAGLKSADEIPGLENYEDQEPEYEVDFNYIVRGFLSHRVPFVLCCMTTQELDIAVKTIHNFLNFVIYHNVCPEFNDSVKEAVATCELAAKELPLCRMMSTKFPGSFNKACSTLFGGYYKSLVRKSDWEDADSTGKPKLDAKILLGNTEHHAEKTFNFALPQVGTEAQISKGQNTKLVYTEAISLRVESMTFPQEGTKSDALGKLHVTLWTPEGEDPIDSKWSNTDGFDLFIEKQVLQYCFKGMCFQCTVHELDTGIIYFEEVTGVMTSFYVEIRDEKEYEVDSSDLEFE